MKKGKNEGWGNTKEWDWCLRVDQGVNIWEVTYNRQICSESPGVKPEVCSRLQFLSAQVKIGTALYFYFFPLSIFCIVARTAVLLTPCQVRVKRPYKTWHNLLCWGCEICPVQCSSLGRTFLSIRLSSLPFGKRGWEWERECERGLSLFLNTLFLLPSLSISLPIPFFM